MEYRLATKKDIPDLIEIRKRQLLDENQTPNIDLDQDIYNYFEKQFDSHRMIEWIVIDQGQIIATGALVLLQFLPSYTNKSGIKGYVTNMYTSPKYRGNKIATKILHKIVEEARKRNISTLILEASQMGKPVYQKFGFERAQGWMQLNL